MGGQAAIRGFLLQTLISLLEILDDDHSWETITVEPDVGNDKVDILLEYSDSIKAIQVKSSINQISISTARKWANELKNSVPNSTKKVVYILQLIGPCSQSVISAQSINSVNIPTPKNLDPLGLQDQAAHRLDIFLNKRGIASVPPIARQILVGAISSKVEEYSTNGETLSKFDFEQLLDRWILQLYPNAITQSVEGQCDILFDNFTYFGDQLIGNTSDDIHFVLPLTFVNTGLRTKIVEWIAVRVSGADNVKLYTPNHIIDFSRLFNYTKFSDPDFRMKLFSEFAIPTDTPKECCVMLSQERKNKEYPYSKWNPGDYNFEVYVKFRDRDVPQLLSSFSFRFESQYLIAAQSGKYTIRMRNITI